MTSEEHTIRVAMARAKVETRKELSMSSGIKDQTMRTRLKNPGGIKLFELRSIARNLDLSPAERLAIADGKEVSACEKLLLDWARSQLRV